LWAACRLDFDLVALGRFSETGSAGWVDEDISVLLRLDRLTAVWRKRDENRVCGKSEREGWTYLYWSCQEVMTDQSNFDQKKIVTASVGEDSWRDV
jgi:hypothetical protein